MFIYEIVTLRRTKCAERECYTGWAVCGQRLDCQGRAGAFQSNTPTSPRQRLGLGYYFSSQIYLLFLYGTSIIFSSDVNSDVTYRSICIYFFNNSLCSMHRNTHSSKLILCVALVT